MKILLIILALSAYAFGQSSSGVYHRRDENGKGEITVKTIKKGKKQYLQFSGYAGGVDRGTCVGEVKGLANFVTPTVAEYNKVEKINGENSFCELTFIFSKGLIIVKEINCSDYHGAACTFAGTYRKGKLK